MSVATRDEMSALAERVLIAGDLRKLSPDDRIRWCTFLAERRKLDIKDGVIDLIESKGKLAAYFNSKAADQLAVMHGISITSLTWDIIDNLCVARCEAVTPDGRTGVDIGAVNVQGLRGEDLANAVLKAITKAKRRCILSLVGIGGGEPEDGFETMRADVVRQTPDMAPERPARQVRHHVPPPPAVPQVAEAPTYTHSYLTDDQQEAMFNAAVERGVGSIMPVDKEQKPSTQRWRDIINAINVAMIQKGVVANIDVLQDDRIKPGQVWRVMLGFPILNPDGVPEDGDPSEDESS